MPGELSNGPLHSPELSGNLDHALGYQEETGDRREDIFTCQTFNPMGASCLVPMFTVKTHDMLRSELGKGQRGSQSVLGTTVAFFTPPDLKSERAGQAEPRRRGNLLIVATSLKLFRLQDV